MFDNARMISLDFHAAIHRDVYDIIHRMTRLPSEMFIADPFAELGDTCVDLRFGLDHNHLELDKSGRHYFRVDPFPQNAACSEM